MKEIRDSLHDPERAVSPVIGVILMVAITVILAAVIGTFVLDLGSSTSQNPQAGVSFEESGGEVTITVTSAPRVTDNSIEVDCGGGSIKTGESATLTSVGDQTICTSLSSGDQITVTAAYQGKTAVIATYTF